MHCTVIVTVSESYTNSACEFLPTRHVCEFYTHTLCVCARARARVCMPHHPVAVCWGSGAAGQAQEGDAGGEALGAEHQLDQARDDEGRPKDESGALGVGGTEEDSCGWTPPATNDSNTFGSR